MAGGDPDALDRARPVLEAMAKRVVHLGPVGTGAAMKLAVNGVLHGLNIALSEGLVLAERAGIEREAAYDVLAGSAVGAPFVAYKRAAFLDPDGTPVAFALDLVAKDLELAASLADEVGAATPQLARNREVVGAAVAAGLGPADLSAVAEYLRALEAGPRTCAVRRTRRSAPYSRPTFRPTASSWSTAIPADLRTATFNGTRYEPSLGNSAVPNSMSLIRTRTGTWPQYSSPLAANLMSALSSSGMRTKKKGAGPRHSITGPSNSKSMTAMR